MTSFRSKKSERNPPYEKMLVADALLMVGFALLSFGLGLSFYHIPAVPQDSLATLVVENGYSQNFTFQLGQGDELLVGVKPYAQANLTLLLIRTDNPQPLLARTASASGSLVNFTHIATIAGEYSVVVFENQTEPSNRAIYCDIELMSIVALHFPARPYLVYGVGLVCAGLTSLVCSRRTAVKVKKGEEWFDWRNYSLPTVFLVSSIGFAVLSSWFVVTHPPQTGMVENVLLVVFSAANVYSLLVGMTILQGRSLLVFIRTLLIAVLVWITTVSLLIYLLPTFLTSSLYYWDSAVFLSSLQSLASIESTVFQIETLLAILVVFYCLSFHYGNQRAYNYLLEVEAVEAGTLKGLFRKLESALRQKNLEEFFRSLQEKDLESSVLLSFLLSDHIESGMNSFTYHGAITDRRNIFSKDIYERKPVETILQPLGYVRVTGEERFKTFKLQTNKPNVSRLIALFKELTNKGKKEDIARWAGAHLLKERRMKYAGLTKSKDSLN